MRPVRFVFMADCQLGCYATFSGMTSDDVEGFASRGMTVQIAPRVTGFAWDAQRYETAIAAANEIGPDFTVMGGDMVDDPTDQAQYEAVVRITAGLHTPMHWVPGNHDIGEDTNVPTAASIAAYRRRFGPDHYAFEHRGINLVVVDTPVWVHAEQVPDEWEQQLAALTSRLRAARERGGPLLVFGHHPLFTRDPQEPDSYWNVPLVRRMMLLDLLAEHGACLYLCGHWHRNGGGWYGDLEVAVTGPIGYPLGDDPSGFRIVEVSDDGVRHEYVALRTAERV